MQFSHLKINGFRSFSYTDVNIPLRDKLVGFIGLNSSGKTTALEAFRKLFGTSQGERELFKSDFHIPHDEIDEPEQRLIKIELTVEFEDDEDSIPHFFTQMVVDEEGSLPYVRIRLEAVWSSSDINPEGTIESSLYFIKVAEGEEEERESKQPFPGHLRNLIQILYVPAIRRPADQIKYASGSILYRLLRKIKWDGAFKEDFKKHVDDISKMFKGQNDVKAIEQSIKGFWNKFHKDKRYNQADLTFGGNDFDSILKKLEIGFSPTPVGRPYRVDDLGEGYRSLFYLTLVCSLLDIEEHFASDDEEVGATRPLLTLLAIEEPENHIAPQLLGRVINILNSIAVKENTQVIVSSHTPAIIKRLKPESICHFQITDEYSSEVHSIVLPEKTDEAYKYIKEAVQNYPEIYFAKLVVIGEGDSEDVIFNRLMAAKKVDFDDNLITFAPLGHRFVNHIWRLLDVLNIPHITLLDLDAERNGGGWGRIKYAIEQLIKIGVDPNKLLKTPDGMIKLEDMSEWEVTDEKSLKTVLSWVNFLAKYNVYFSVPLDLDFLMLSHYPETYKEIVLDNGGPRIPDKEKKKEAYEAKVADGIKATLKSEDATGDSYNDEQKELMIWYNYHFLNRGKPSTHIQAFSALSNRQLVRNLPPVFNDIFKKIGKILGVE